MRYMVSQLACERCVKSVAVAVAVAFAVAVAVAFKIKMRLLKSLSAVRKTDSVLMARFDFMMLSNELSEKLSPSKPDRVIYPNE